MPQLDHPRQQFSFDSILNCTGDLGHLDIRVGFDGLDGFDKEWQLKELCTKLVNAVKDPSDHLLQLNTQLAGLMPGVLKHDLNLLDYSGDTKSNQALVGKANRLLSRLPKAPQRLFSLPLSISRLSAAKKTVWDVIKDGRWPSRFFVPEARSLFETAHGDDAASIMQGIEEMQDNAWDNLFVTSFIDTNNMIFILKIVYLNHQPDYRFALAFQAYVNLLGELVDEYDALIDAVKFGTHEIFDDPAPSVQALKAAFFPVNLDEHNQSLSVLQAYLWTAWQRSVMLFFYYLIGVRLWHESLHSWNSLMAIRGVRRLVDLDAKFYRGDSTQYLCNWAFELLRTSRTSVALDFRRMIKLFDDHFRGRGGRCINESALTCKGDVPETCQRFTGAESKSQSMHAAACDVGSCTRITWNETSYRQCKNPRAVIADEQHDFLHYYSSCIPDDLQLRKEAIMSINQIFCDSKVTLISDRDLQSVSIHPASIANYETLLSILLVCDWGVRAWTMLEAIRGNKSIHILCAGDYTVKLVELLRTVHRQGNVDVVVLLGSAQHLLPASDSDIAKPIEEAGHLLSQRHASRQNDEIVIWGLVSNMKAPADVVQLWKAHEHVATAFLMSSAQRVHGSAGYGWAPATPYIRPQRRTVTSPEGHIHGYSVRYPSYDGIGSYPARITVRGLHGLWLVHDMDQTTVSDLYNECIENMGIAHWTADPNLVSSGSGCDCGPDEMIFERPDYAKACDMLRALLCIPHTKARVIRPLNSGGTSVYLGNDARGEDFAGLIAICVCHGPWHGGIECDELDTAGCGEWEWKGVFEWRDELLEDWMVREMLII
ncbi:MAG: hypothetical protein Q9169_007516 [Polycauliona sp. 2 TL-2023]